MGSGALALFTLLVVQPGEGRGQPVRPPASPVERRVAIGGVGGPGNAGLLGAFRLSVPASPRVSFDADGGLVSSTTDRSRGMLGAQLRWLRKVRGDNGMSDYGIFGVMHMREERRTEIRFPDQTIVRTEHVSGITPVVGYGIDWVHATGTRAGVEITGGGSENAGPRLFAKGFVVWAFQR